MTDHIKTIRAALKFYAKHCPQNSLDGPEGMPTAFKAKEALSSLTALEEEMGTKQRIDKDGGRE